MAARDIIGHQKALHALSQAVREERLHHTLLFSGPEGIGKRLIAQKLAATFFCESKSPKESFGGCPSDDKQCHHCTLMASGSMPDLISISCADKAAASTAAVRDLLHSLRLRPFSGHSRFLLFDDAHLLQGQAANALLKSLEEPRPGTFFILITGKPHLMLQTIHSRAQRWGFHRLTEEELRQVVSSQKDADMQIDEKAIPLANGSYDAYQLMAYQEHVPALTKDLLSIAHGSRAKAMELGAQLAQSKETLRNELTRLHLIARYFLHETHDLQWANFLHELGEMDYYLLKRNFAPLYLLQTLFLHLANPYPEQFVVEPTQTLDHLVLS